MKKLITCIIYLLHSISNYAQEVESSLHHQLKDRFIEGGWQFMSLTLICLILGLIIFVRKLITLHLSDSNNFQILEQIETLMESDNGKQIIVLLGSTNGATSRVFSKGIKNRSRGLIKVQEILESSISVERGILNNGLPWMTLFISLAPMLGFMGTVLGMIQAFDAISNISEGGNMSPGIVADGIKIALITTVSGLVIAVMLQLFYNYLVYKIDIFMNELEEAASYFMDLLVKQNIDT